MLLDEQYRKLEDAYRHQGGNAVVLLGKLCVGVLGYAPRQCICFMGA